MALADHLRRRVVAQQVQPHGIHFDGLGLHILLILQPMQKGRCVRLDHEPAVGGEMGGDLLEAAHLFVLGQQVEEGVEHDVDQPVDARNGHCGKVADRDRKLVAARPSAQLVDHRRGQVDAIHADAARGQGQGDPARADAKLQRRPRSRHLRQQRHGCCFVAALQVTILAGNLFVKAHRRPVVLHDEIAIAPFRTMARRSSVEQRSWSSGNESREYTNVISGLLHATLSL